MSGSTYGDGGSGRRTVKIKSEWGKTSDSEISEAASVAVSAEAGWGPVSVSASAGYDFGSVLNSSSHSNESKETEEEIDLSVPNYFYQKSIKFMLASGKSFTIHGGSILAHKPMAMSKRVCYNADGVPDESLKCADRV